MLNQLYEDYCVNRLPCGICRLMNAICPRNAQKIDITCNPNKTPWTDPTIDIYYNTNSSAKVTTSSEVTAQC